MELNQIKKHWENLANQYGQKLGATTKTSTIKKLEINALFETIAEVNGGTTSSVDLLEVGCGNGHNCFALSEHFPNYTITGVDYVPQMITSAKEIQASKKSNKINFFVGDVLALDKHENLKEKYNIVLTNRCLINLNTLEFQLSGLEQLSKKIEKGGHLVLIENSIKSYRYQNDCREAIGLPRRTPDKYNLFIDENAYKSFAEEKLGLRLVEINDFASLHDLLLYVLLPKINDGKVSYDHPMMNVVTEMLLGTSMKFKNRFGDFGQNRLFLFKNA